MPLAFRSARALSSTSQMSVSGRRPFGSLRVSACAGPFKGYAVPPSEMKNGFPLAHQRALIDAKRPDLAGPEIRSRDHAVGAYRATAVLEFAGGGYHGREQQHEPDQCTRSRAGPHPAPRFAFTSYLRTRRSTGARRISYPSPEDTCKDELHTTPRPSDDRKGDANPGQQPDFLLYASTTPGSSMVADPDLRFGGTAWTAWPDASAVCSQSYDVGTLYLEIIDPRSKRIVWIGATERASSRPCHSIGRRSVSTPQCTHLAKFPPGGAR